MNRYGLTLSVEAMADWPWPLVMGVSFVLFAILQGLTWRVTFFDAARFKQSVPADPPLEPTSVRD